MRIIFSFIIQQKKTLVYGGGPGIWFAGKIFLRGNFHPKNFQNQGLWPLDFPTGLIGKGAEISGGFPVYQKERELGRFEIFKAVLFPQTGGKNSARKRWAGKNFGFFTEKFLEFSVNQLPGNEGEGRVIFRGRLLIWRTREIDFSASRIRIKIPIGFLPGRASVGWTEIGCRNRVGLVFPGENFPGQGGYPGGALLVYARGPEIARWGMVFWGKIFGEN